MKKFFYLTVSLFLWFSNMFCNEPNTNFIENKGQLFNNLGGIENEILFYTSSNTHNFYIKDGSICIVSNGNYPNIQTTGKNELATYRFDIDFINTNKEMVIIKDEQNTEKYHFYYDLNAITDVHSYKKILLNEFYKNIDVVYYYNNNIFKYDFILKPGAFVNEIKFEINGAINTYISNNGELIIETPLGDFKKPKPFVFQYDNQGYKISINTDYQLDDGLLSFIIRDDYDKNKDLIIDPEIGLVSYCGGNREESLFSIKQDKNGDFYLCGQSSSMDFPATPGAIQLKPNGSIDGYVMKFDSNWKLQWTTFLGGSSDDRLLSLITGKNYIWVSGETTGYGYPITPDALQKTYAGGSGDIVLTKLSKEGKLIYSSLLGAGSYDSSPEAVLDNDENLWLTGRTNSMPFRLTADAEQTSGGNMYSAFIVKIDKNHFLKYSSLYASDNNVYGEGIACDSNNNIYITGISDSKNLPNSNKGFQSQNAGNYDAFLAKFDNSGKHIWSSFLGGALIDLCSNIAIDKNNDIYIFGHTNSTNFPVKNSNQEKLKGSSDSFLAKLSSDSKLIWSTYHGGTGYEGHNNFEAVEYQLAGISVKDSKVAVSASTRSNDFPCTSDAFQSKINGSIDAFYSIFSTNEGEIEYSTYFGGANDERPYDVLLDNNDRILNVGRTSSNNLKTSKGVFQEKFGGGSNDGYIFGANVNLCNQVVNYDKFYNVDKLYLNGNAYYLDEYIRLTTDKKYQGASVWLIDKIGTNIGFETTFSFNTYDSKDYPGFDDTPYPGADGIAFVIQNNSLSIQGNSGGGIGFEGIPNSIAIEFDLFHNKTTDVNDPNGNHIAVFSNGTEPNDCNHSSKSMLKTESNILPIKNDGTTYYSKIIYDGVSNNLKVYLDENQNNLTNPILELNDFNLKNLLNLKESEYVWVGFTSSTGESIQKQNLLSWNLCSFDPTTIISVDEKIANESNFNIFPNPVSDYLNIKLNENFNDLIKVEILDYLGRKVIERNLGNSELNNNITINTKDLLPGLYYFQIIGAYSTKNLKFIKL